MDDVVKPRDPGPAREAYEAPRLHEIGSVDELTLATAPSVQDDLQ